MPVVIVGGFAGAQHEKTRHGGRVLLDSRSLDADARTYPTDVPRPGRGAREVMPAAMRALVRTIGWVAESKFMRRAKLPAISQQRNSTGPRPAETAAIPSA